MEIRKIIFRVLILLTLQLCVFCKKIDFQGYFFNSDPVNERIAQSLILNESNPDKKVVVSGSDYNLLIAADSHVGGTVNLDAFFSDAAVPGTSGIVMVGDITSGRSEDYDVFKHEIDSKNIIPAFLVAGNHDLYFNGWETFLKYFGSSTYSFSVQCSDASDLYICLDSGGGTLGWKQLNWLKNLLETERKNFRYCIMFSHVNLFREHRTGSTNPLVDEIRVMLDLCSTHSIDMVIMGHDHNRAEELFGKTRFITLDALVDNFENASYLKLEVKKTGLAYAFRDL